MDCHRALTKYLIFALGTFHGVLLVFLLRAFIGRVAVILRIAISNLSEFKPFVLLQVVTRDNPSVVKQPFSANATLVEIPDGCIFERIQLKSFFKKGQVVARHVPPELLPGA